MKQLLIALLFILFDLNYAQIDARLFQYPDVSKDKITFSYAGDIWIVKKDGGTAVKLSSPKGTEVLPKFSPDGKFIAFSANYNGNVDIYTVPVEGGIPNRVTFHSYNDRMLDWMPGGDELLFASSRNSGRQRFSQLYTIDAKGGLAQKLPVPYGEFASVSEDGQWLAYTPRTRLYRTWKRYRGGMAADIWLFNLKTFESKNITDNDANDEMPMFHNNQIYFLSDRGAEKRYNIWVYNLNDGTTKQLTHFKDYDVHFPSIGPDDIVFEAEGKLYLLNLVTEQTKEVEVKIIYDEIKLLPQLKNVERYISNASVSPDGKRVVVEARGEIFSLPAKDGVVYNLSNSDGSAERYPKWSPDGKYIAYWSDASGEYELYLKDINSDKPAEKLTSTGSKYKYHLFWSPNSKMVAFIDNAMNIRIFDLDDKDFIEVDKALYKFHGALEGFTVSWSPDSRYLAYSRGVDNQQSAIFIFDTKENKLHQVTSGFYSDDSPAFDPEGKYLFITTKRKFSPLYSSLQNTFVYPNSTQLAAIPLTKEIESPLKPKNDVVKIEKDKKKDKKDKEKKKDEDKDKSKETKIDFAGFESRLVLLPVDAGNYYNLFAVKGKLVFSHYPNSGTKGEKPKIEFYDLEDRETKTIVKGTGNFEISADGKNMLVLKGRKLYIVKVKANQKLKDAVPTSEMKMMINPMHEFEQIFTDAWRLERDYFYDENMHGVDWNEVKERYGKLVKFAADRSDLNFLLGEMIGELNASHTYKGGGDVEWGERVNVGYLGIDWSKENGRFKIEKIIKGAPWDAEVKSPFSEPGVNVKEGEFILAVNGIPIDVNKEPYAAFQGLADKTIELTVNDKPSFDGSRKVIVKTLSSEARLRHLAWIERNRKMVDELSEGKVGYVYVRSTGIDGQNELIRQFIPQIDKEAIVIDERFNSGGQIPDRFIELLNRKPLAFWKVRDGRTWQWPPTAHFGPKAMLINGWSGSGGDAFPDYFRKAKLGKLIGMRTWGGLIGISGAPSLIDGGMITVPTFRMLNPDGTWFAEGHGVDPDIKVVDNPTEMAKGNDPQLEKAVNVLMDELKNWKKYPPELPEPEKR